MDCLPDKKKLEETPGIVVSKFGTNDGQSEDTKAPSRKKAKSDCLIQEKVQIKNIKERFERVENKSS